MLTSEWRFSLRNQPVATTTHRNLLSLLPLPNVRRNGEEKAARRDLASYQRVVDNVDRRRVSSHSKKKEGCSKEKIKEKDFIP
jgi:hypothetical protein